MEERPYLKVILNRSATQNNAMGSRNLSQAFSPLRVGIFDQMPLLNDISSEIRNQQMTKILLKTQNCRN